MFLPSIYYTFAAAEISSALRSRLFGPQRLQYVDAAGVESRDDDCQTWRARLATSSAITTGLSPAPPGRVT